MGRHGARRPGTRSAATTCCSWPAAASSRIPDGAGRRRAPASGRPGTAVRAGTPLADAARDAPELRARARLLRQAERQPMSAPPHRLVRRRLHRRHRHAGHRGAAPGCAALLFLGVPDARAAAQRRRRSTASASPAPRARWRPTRCAPNSRRSAALLRRAAARACCTTRCCSTFDSAPRRRQHRRGHPRCCAPPCASRLGRASSAASRISAAIALFGNLFAAAGSGGAVHRIDRHPTMSRHPVTPMHEADLRRHLALQGLEPIGLVPWTLYGDGAEAIAAPRWPRCAPARAGAVLFDVARRRRPGAPSGRHSGAAPRQAPLLAVGPSSVVAGHRAHRCRRALRPCPIASRPRAGRCWCSRAACRRSRRARSRPPRRTTSCGSMRRVWSRQTAATAPARRATSRPCWPRDATCSPAPARMAARRRRSLRATSPAAGGALLARVLAAAPSARLGIAGGDTSSLRPAGARRLGPVLPAGLVAPGAPLCRLHSESAALDGLEVMLKGGQMGGGGPVRAACSRHRPINWRGRAGRACQFEVETPTSQAATPRKQPAAAARASAADRAPAAAATAPAAAPPAAACR